MISKACLLRQAAACPELKRLIDSLMHVIPLSSRNKRPVPSVSSTDSASRSGSRSAAKAPRKPAIAKKKIFGNRKMKINVNIQEVTDIDANAELIYQSIRDQMEQRVPFRRAIKRALEQIKREMPKLIVVMDNEPDKFPELQRFLDLHYYPNNQYEYMTLYLLQENPR